MTNKQLIDQVEEIVAKCENICYEGVSIGQALKVMVHSYLWTFEVSKVKRFSRYLTTLRWMAVACKRLGAGVIFHFCRSSSDSLDRVYQKKVIVVCDHSNHVFQMTSYLLERFNKEDILFVTTSSQVYDCAQNTYPFKINLYARLFFLNWKRLPLYYRYYSQFARCVPQSDGVFKVQFFLLVCSVLQAIEYYKRSFETVGISAVITMSDRHWHEYVIAQLARHRGIRTYTNQHGEFGDPIGYIPIASDEIFVWGDVSRQFLIESGVPSNQIVISGNPKFDQVHSFFLPQKKEHRSAMQKKYHLEPKQLTIVLLSSGISPEIPEGRVFDVVKCFCRLADLPINLLIKLHPNPVIDNLELYQRWLSELGVLDRVKIIQSEDLFNVLVGTDIAVTLFSTAGLEAIGFHIPTIILDILDGVHLRQYVTFMDDAIVCKSSPEFYSILSRFIDQPEYLKMEIERTKKSCEKYFKNSENFNTSEFVKNYILSAINEVN